MKKKLFVLAFCFVIFIYDSISASQNKMPIAILLGISRGQIVKVDLNDWTVKYLVKSEKKYAVVADLKYYEKSKKAVFAILEDNNNLTVGIYDFNKDGVDFLDPSKAGLHENIINLSISAINVNDLIISTNINNSLWLEGKNENEIEGWEKTLKYGCYNVVSDTLTVIQKPKVEDLRFFPNGVPPKTKAMQNYTARKYYQDNKLIRRNDKSYHLIKKGKRYDLLRLENKLVIIDANPSSKMDGKYKEKPVVYKFFPNNFGKNDKRLLSPISAEFVMDEN